MREQSKCFAKHVREEYKKLCTKEKEQHENQFMVLTYSKYSCWAVTVLVTSIALDVVLNKATRGNLGQRGSVGQMLLYIDDLQQWLSVYHWSIPCAWRYC